MGRSTMHNILITGANGQLGNEMRLLGATSSNNYIYTDVAELDITDRTAVELFIKEHHINYIVNCAAYTNVDKAEDDYDTAELLNATAVENLAIAAKANDAVLVHISTDYVFGGNVQNTPCNEELATAPTGVYGLTKLHGEEAILRTGCRHIIIRTAWLYSIYGNNFLKTMLRLTAERPSLNVVYDQVGTPTYAADLAAAIFDIVEGDKAEGNDGTYHFSNEGVCSWYDFAKEIARQAGHDGCCISPCRSSEFPSKVVRPAYSVLDKSKMKRTFGTVVPYWSEAVARCLNKLKNE